MGQLEASRSSRDWYPLSSYALGSLPTDTGLVLVARYATGIWFIPYDAIEEYCRERER
jgi:hypothetical protein